MNQATLYCAGCGKDVFAGFFSAAQKAKKYDKTRRCIPCAAAESANNRRHDWTRRARVKGRAA